MYLPIISPSAAPCRLILYIFLLWLVSVAAYAVPAQDVGGKDVRLADFPVGYFIDSSESLTYETAQNKTFEATNSTATLGTGASVTWHRITLDNAGPEAKALFLHLPAAFQVRALEIYEERSQSLVGQARVDLNNASNNPLMYRGTVVYPFSVPAGETTVLFVRSHLYSHQWFAAEIYDDQNSRKALVGGHLDIALLVGMMVALVFYNGLLYFATSKKENILYSLYLISGVVWIALSYGLIAEAFNIYGDAVFILNLSVFTMPIFLVLFMMSIFETREFYITEHRVLSGLLVLLVGGFCYGLFDIEAALIPASSLAALMMLVTFSVSLSMWRKGNPLAKFFLVGHSFFVVFNGFAVLFYKGVIEPNYLNSHGVGIGIVLEAITLAFIISYRIKVLEDIRAQQGELKRQAATDPLTQLYNRRYFMTEGESLIEKARALGEPVSVVTLDIDYFKKVNDTYGHHAGDLVLKGVAVNLQKFSRDRDLIARFGGEEFMVLLPGADHAEAKGCAERIRQGVEKHSVQVGDGVSIRVTVSLGVTQINSAKESLEAAANRADKALYDAKTGGRNRVCCAA
ncbi:sensor domain-containing diguanylate cyclase [Marinobacter salexigens]|uniref:diguanylate cyclase n=1 Tax=Marinobacter salexigens TaxID=1925763 RepID=A0ABS6A6D3_9GAMM|nr:diguanylate cyclase [Marinobacter salexigens]MBU2873768.1 sensor domain-containing diguanylate cyclase [Marinobacter salexigens]